MSIYNECCLKTMQRIKDDQIDLVITSPPYNMNLRIRNGEYCSRQIVKELSSKYEGFDDNLPINEFYEFHKSVLSELIRVSKLVFYNIQIVTGSKRAFFKIIGDFSEYLKDVFIWDKGHAEPAISAGVLNRQTELLLVFDKYNAISRKFDKCNFDRGCLTDLWKIKRERSKNKNHKATFPEKLVETIILNFSNPNDLIYDPFSGTGTTAYIANKTGRKYAGSEITKDYYYYYSLDRLKIRQSKYNFIVNNYTNPE